VIGSPLLRRPAAGGPPAAPGGGAERGRPPAHLHPQAEVEPPPASRTGGWSVCRERGEDLDREPAGGLEVEGPASVLYRRWWDIEPVLLQASVDLVHRLRALLGEADVERGGVPDLLLAADLHARQREHQAVVVRQEGDVVVPAHVPQPEVAFEELVG